MMSLLFGVLMLFQIPQAISDDEFWRLVTSFSEPSGQFQQEFMSNEDSSQFVIPTLKQTSRRGGIYIGVGPEQNFTYIAALRPRLSFVVDIRRDNMLEHLMYKALFELAPDRADFLSLLFSRRRPPGLDAGSTAAQLFDAYDRVEPDSKMLEQSSRNVIELLARHKFQLTDADKERVMRTMNVFYTAGPSLRGTGDLTLPYAQMMTATDLLGQNQSYLGSEENFLVVQEMEKKNLIVPLVGDFAGDRALVSIGRYLKEHDAIVDVFYVSNVERYLFGQGDDAKRFYANVATLPIDQSGTFIRSVTSDISRRLGVPLPSGTTKWRSLLSPISQFLTLYKSGRIQTYRDALEVTR